MTLQNNKKTTIIYVNFAPYENTGNIRDYLLETYRTVVIFAFNFHRLTKLDQPSTLSVYCSKKRSFQTRLYQTPFLPSLAFILLPVRSFVIFLQIIFQTARLQKRFGPFGDFFTVNAFIAWTGLILKKLGLVQRTLFWVWDYYPPVHKSRMVMFMRSMYWQFDKPASNNSDRTIYLNHRMVNVRKKLKILAFGEKPLIVPIGTKTVHTTAGRDKFAFVFLGVLKQSQGLDLFFDSLPSVKRISSLFSLHIIGGGPDESHYRRRAQTAAIPVYFHGYQASDTKVDTILSRCGIGIATYVPDSSNVSYWGEPSKIKRYLSLGIPVITTDVFEFSGEIAQSKCGIVISYHPKDFVRALRVMVSNYRKFRSAAQKVARQYHYQTLYKPMFAE